MLWFQKAVMKSRLSVLAALATLVFAGLPAQTLDKEVHSRARSVVFIALGECLLKAGKTSQEKLDEGYVKFHKKYHYIKPAFVWASTSRNGQEAIKAISPYLGADCAGLLNDEQAMKIMMPYLK